MKNKVIRKLCDHSGPHDTYNVAPPGILNLDLSVCRNCKAIKTYNGIAPFYDIYQQVVDGVASGTYSITFKFHE